MVGKTLSKLANPALFMRFTRPVVPIAAGLAFILLAAGTVMALFFSPPDYKQGESVRIMYVHVPAAIMSMQVYALIAICSFVGFIWRHRLADIIAKAAAPLGLAFTVLALITGALWGKVTWGVYWDWDPRLTSVLVLAFIYAGYIALWAAIENEATAARITALLAMLGAVNLPIIKFSVEWWDSLHQKASIRLTDRADCLEQGMKAPAALLEDVAAYCDGLGLVESTMPAAMLWPLTLMTLGYIALTAFYIILRTRTDLLSRKTDRSEARAPSTATMEPAP